MVKKKMNVTVESIQGIVLS